MSRSQFYRTKWNVIGLNGLVGPGGLVELGPNDAKAQADLGAIEPDPVSDADQEAERLTAILAKVPSLAVGDFTQAGQLRAEARRRLAGELGFEPTDDEIRTAGEAYAKAQPPA